MIDRRGFLKNVTGAAVGLAAGGLFPGAAEGAFRMFQRPSSTGRVLVLVNMLGGYDALALVPPLNGSALTKYVSNRPRLSTKSGPSAYLPLNGVSGFGLHPALGVLQTQFNNGDMAIVQKTGLPVAELSHFSSQEIMSRGRGTLANPNTTGWIGRLADAYFPNALDIVGLGVPNRVDFNAVGTRPLVMANLSNFATYEYLSGADHYLRRDKLDSMVSQVFANDDRINAVARAAADRGFDQSVFVANAVAPVSLTGNYSYTGVYNQVPGNGPHTDALGKSLKDIAKMIIAPTIGTRVFYTQASDFDTHGRQEAFTGSPLGDRPSLTDRLHVTMAALNGFITDIQSSGKWNTTTIVLFTEFGRRNVENATDGTDHGHGFHAFVLGGAVNGGMKGNFVTSSDQSPTASPTPHPNLPVEIDYREIFKQCIEGWLQLPSANPIFNDYSALPGQPSFTLF
jgi:uncharacterized protein (DUF1501 family)